MKFEYIITAVLLFFIAVLFTCGSCVDYVPYYRDSKFLKGYTFEPFGIDMGLSANVDANTVGSSLSGGGAVAGGDISAGAGIDVGAGANAGIGGGANVGASLTLPSFGNKEKKEGFEGMLSPLTPAVVGYDPSLDVFSQDAGSIDCISRSSSLFNSRGGLCLTDDQIMLLKTRGGNAAGGDGKYGP